MLWEKSDYVFSLADGRPYSPDKVSLAFVSKTPESPATTRPLKLPTGLVLPGFDEEAAMNSSRKPGYRASASR